MAEIHYPKEHLEEWNDVAKENKLTNFIGAELDSSDVSNGSDSELGLLVYRFIRL